MRKDHVQNIQNFTFILKTKQIGIVLLEIHIKRMRLFSKKSESSSTLIHPQRHLAADLPQNQIKMMNKSVSFSLRLIHPILKSDRKIVINLPIILHRLS